MYNNHDNHTQKKEKLLCHVAMVVKFVVDNKPKTSLQK